MTFVFITDTHFTSQTPINRTDNLLDSLLDKFEYVLDYAKKKKTYVVHGGDFFDSPRVGDDVATRVSDLLYKYKVHVYGILGQHDLIGKNIESSSRTKMGLFKRLKYFHLLMKPKVIDNIALHPFNFDVENPVPVEVFVKRKEKKFNVAVIHGMIADKNLMIKSNCIMKAWDAVTTNADLVLSGDYHPGYGIQEHMLVGHFCNPGSIARMDIGDKNRKPMLAYIQVKKRSMTNCRLKGIPCLKQPFNLKAIAAKVTAKDERDKFIKALQELSDVKISSDNALQLLDGVKNQSKKVIKRCKKKIRELNK